MKKKLLLIPVLLVVFLLSATPVLADDPPGVDVDINVSTPGDADVGIDINGGGDVDVTVDGYDLDQMVDQVTTTKHLLSGGAWSGADVKNYVNPLFADLYVKLTSNGEVLNLLAMAQAKLINQQELTGEEVKAVNTVLDEYRDTVSFLDEHFTEAVSSLESRDAEIYNQLMYGAEYHLEILDSQVQTQSRDIEALESDIEALQAYKQQSDEYIASLVSYLNMQAHKNESLWFITWGFIGFIAVLLIVMVCILARLRKFSADK